MLNALANLATRRSRTVIVSAILASIVAGVLGAGVASRLDPYGADDPATESVQADNRLDDAGYQDLGLIALLRGVDVSSPKTKHRVESLASRISRDPAVGRISDYYTTGSQAFVSRDGNATYLAVTLKPTDDKARQDAARRIADRLDGASGVTLGGPSLAQEQVNKQVESDLRKAEMLAFPFLFLLSLLFFRSGVAALLPPLIGGLAIVGTFLMLRVASELTSVSIFALNLVTGLGLGLAIDYSLFMVSRYREEIARSGPGAEAMRRTLATAGRTIVFSSLTVAAALASLLIFPQRFLYSMGLGGSMVALIAAGLALVVLPAILAALGTRVNSLAPAFLQRRAEREARPAESGFWYRLSRFVMRRPGPIAIVSATFLIVLGIPFWGIKFTSVDATVLPTSASARQVDTAMKTEFPPHRDAPIELAVSGANRAQLQKLSAEARRIPGVAAVNQPVRLAGGVAEIDVIPRYNPLSDQGQDVATALRDMPTGSASVQVTGFTAHFIDTKSSLVDHLPIALAIVVITTFIVLFVMTGSVVLPIKALVMNVLTLSAVFGILVLDLPGRAPRGTARLYEPGRVGDDHAAAPVRGRLRPLDRLRRLPAVQDQGGARRRRQRLRVGRDRARAHGANRHRRRAPVRGCDRRLRDLGNHLHQGERARHRARRADRRQHRPGPARALADGAAGEVELVGAPPAATPVRPDPGQRGIGTD